MPDPKELANKARSTLAQALEALQSGDNEELMEVAEPIANTMGLLHRIEREGGGDGPSVQRALDNVRGALDKLQSVTQQDDAVDAAMEAVAGSLSRLFTLHRVLAAEPAPQASAAPQPAASPQPAPVPAHPAAPQDRAHVGFGGTHVMEQSDELRAAVVMGATAAAAPPQQQQAMGLLATTPSPQAPQQPAFPAAHAAVPHAQPVLQPAGGFPAAGAADPLYPADHHVPGTTGAPPPPDGSPYVNVELGAHSSSNFYKGLSGNDVIEHGGIFVATYQIPKIGTPVALRMLLPGDLEFEADAVVQWTRETRGGDTDPGFGAKFTRITPEGRQLVYRYVKNREPMFYDDM